MDSTYSKLKNQISLIDIDLESIERVGKVISIRKTTEKYLAHSLMILTILGIIFSILIDISDGEAAILQLFNPVEFYWTNYTIWLLISLFSFAIYLRDAARNTEYKRETQSLKNLTQIVSKNNTNITELTPFLSDDLIILLTNIKNDSTPSKYLTNLFIQLIHNEKKVKDNSLIDLLQISKKFDMQRIISQLDNVNYNKNKLENLIKLACIKSPHDQLLQKDLLLTTFETEINHLLNVDIKSIRGYWEFNEINKKIQKNLRTSRVNILPKINNSLTTIYAPFTEEYCREILIDKKNFELTIHWKDLIYLIDILEEPNESILLISKKGVGKSEVIKSLAGLIEANSAGELNNQRLIKLDFNYLLRHLQKPEDISNIFENIINEIKNSQNIILIIDEFDDLMSLPKKSQSILISLIESELLLNKTNKQSSNLKILMTIDEQSYNSEQIPKNLLKLFKPVTLSEPTKLTTSLLLQRKIQSFLKSRIQYNFDSLVKIVELNSFSLLENSEPQKSLITLQKIIKYCEDRKYRFIDTGVVEEHFRFNRNFNTLPTRPHSNNHNYTNLEDLRKTLSSKLLGQPEVIRKIINILSQKNNPKLLLYGPTGVGKKTTAELIAEYFLGDKKYLKSCIAQDFAATTINEIITHVKTHPYSVIYIEEVSKINKLLISFLDRVFKSNEIEISRDNFVNFENVIFIFTTELTGEWINENFQDNDESNYQRLAIATGIEITSQINPIFIEKTDEIIMYRAINYPLAYEIVESEIKKIKLNLENRGFELVHDQKFIEKIVKENFYKNNGASRFSKAINKEVDKQISKRLLNGKINSGGIIDLTVTIN
jgi:ATP-dependent Clp protease ATP-binding subunit ClpA